MTSKQSFCHFSELVNEISNYYQYFYWSTILGYPVQVQDLCTSFTTAPNLLKVYHHCSSESFLTEISPVAITSIAMKCFEQKVMEYPRLFWTFTKTPTEITTQPRIPYQQLSISNAVTWKIKDAMISIQLSKQSYTTS